MLNVNILCAVLIKMWSGERGGGGYPPRSNFGGKIERNIIATDGLPDNPPPAASLLNIYIASLYNCYLSLFLSRMNLTGMYGKNMIPKTATIDIISSSIPR